MFLWGCQIEERVAPSVPPVVFLSDASGQSVGIAVPIRENIFVTADHLREKYGDLFWNDERAEVFARDFENNILFLTLDDWFGNGANWNHIPPAVGEEIFWVTFDPRENKDTPILTRERVKALPYRLGQDDIQNQKIVLSGTSDLPHSGSPVFGIGGQVFGILVGGDREKNLSYAVRGDIILQILEEHLE